MTVSDFDDHLTAWREYTASPWGRIRYAVVAHTLDLEIARLGGGPLRVLDVGGGDGLDVLRLAAAGHEVTVVDPSEPMLAAARQGSRITTVLGDLDSLAAHDLVGFDLVLCHFVLQYRPPGDADLLALLGCLRPGGTLSLVAPNPAGRVLGALVRRGPAAAEQALVATSERSQTFDTSVRLVEADGLVERLARLGAVEVARYGGRIANDLLTDDEAKGTPELYADLERLELALCAREPFLRVGMFWQVVVRKEPVDGVVTPG
ncbi:MAG: class I SAM-dependent methyltransferase [Marmoricola sp.]